MTSGSEKPFLISIPTSELATLKQRLALTKFPNELDDARWEYGVPLADVKRLVARWQDGYDWKRHELALNVELPQFTRDITVDHHGTLNIHYVHKRSNVFGAIPLLFVHGWPGSFLEVRKILPLLIQSSDEHPSFHVVAFSLPNFGFSEGPTTKGFAMSQYAEVGHKLMLALGYNEYVTQGGDWGYMITRHIAANYGPKHCKAWHTNFPWLLSAPTLSSSPGRYLSNLLTRYSAAEKKGLERTAWFTKQGWGYFAEQSTQPQTLGYGLSDSPAALLAWVYEKLVNWTDGYPWTDDEVLTWVSIYWFSKAGPAASVRIYYEYVNEKPLAEIPKVPQGASYFPKELIVVPRSWTRTPYLIFESEHKAGGHFASYEKPVELVGDLRRMFGKKGPTYRVIKDKTGYKPVAYRARL